MLTDHRKVVARLAWSLLYLLCVGLAVGTLLLSFLNGVDLVEFVVESNAAVAVLIISFSVIGALIAPTARGTPSAGSSSAPPTSRGLSNPGYEYATYTLITEPGSLPLGAKMSWLKDCIWVPGLGLLLVFPPLLFPDGRPPSRRWRPVA